MVQGDELTSDSHAGGTTCFLLTISNSLSRFLHQPLQQDELKFGLTDF